MVTLKTNDVWGAIAPGYSKWVSPYLLHLGKELILNSGISSGSDVLDLGCGTGDLSKHMANLGAKVTGLDRSFLMLRENPSLAQANFSKQWFQPYFIQGEASNIPCQNNSFDFVVANFIMEQGVYRTKALEEISRVLRPGGKLLFSVWKTDPEASESKAIEAVLNVFNLSLAMFPRQFDTEKQINSELTLAGFTTTRVRNAAKLSSYADSEEFLYSVKNSNPFVARLLAEQSRNGTAIPDSSFMHAIDKVVKEVGSLTFEFPALLVTAIADIQG